MTLPTDRTSFKGYCLRKLGAPVIFMIYIVRINGVSTYTIKALQ